MMPRNMALTSPLAEILAEKEYFPKRPGARGDEAPGLFVCAKNMVAEAEK